MFDIKNFVLGVAIFILTVSVGIYGINTFYKKAPNYNDYCPNIIGEKQCTDAGGEWANYTITQPSSISGKPESVPSGKGECIYDYNKCQKEYDKANEIYSKGVFYIALPLGIIVIALGAIIFGLASVGGGLMTGGVGILFYGLVEFWQYAKDVLKFSLSLVGLIVVIYLAYYANKRWMKKDHKR